MKRLDLEELKLKKCIKVGIISQKVIQLLNLNIKTCNIVLWEDRLFHLELHKDEYQSNESYLKHIELIPEIIDNPDYIGLHPTKSSIEFIKRIDELIIVAVRLKNSGNLAVRTVFVLSENQLNEYIRNKSILKFHN